jgi:hypothetical protein
MNTDKGLCSCGALADETLDLQFGLGVVEEQANRQLRNSEEIDALR